MEPGFEPWLTSRPWARLQAKRGWQGGRRADVPTECRAVGAVRPEWGGAEGRGTGGRKGPDLHPGLCQSQVQPGTGKQEDIKRQRFESCRRQSRQPGGKGPGQRAGEKAKKKETLKIITQNRCLKSKRRFTSAYLKSILHPDHRTSVTREHPRGGRLAVAGGPGPEPAAGHERSIEAPCLGSEWTPPGGCGRTAASFLASFPGASGGAWE